MRIDVFAWADDRVLTFSKSSTCSRRRPSEYAQIVTLDPAGWLTRFQIEKEAENTPNSGKVEWFLQGTLYPDVSVSFFSSTVM